METDTSEWEWVANALGSTWKLMGIQDELFKSYLINFNYKSEPYVLQISKGVQLRLEVWFQDALECVCVQFVNDSCLMESCCPVCVWIVVEVLCDCGGMLEIVIQRTDGDKTGCACTM